MESFGVPDVTRDGYGCPMGETGAGAPLEKVVVDVWVCTPTSRVDDTESRPKL